MNNNTQQILNKSGSQEVQQIGELLSEIEYEYRDFMNGAISVKAIEPLKTVKDITEIHIPVSDYIEVGFLKEDLEDLVATLKNTEAKICIDITESAYDVQPRLVVSAKNGAWIQ